MNRTMFEESCDEAMAQAQIEYDIEQYRLAHQTDEKGSPAPVETGNNQLTEINHGIHCF